MYHYPAPLSRNRHTGLTAIHNVLGRVNVDELVAKELTTEKIGGSHSVRHVVNV